MRERLRRMVRGPAPPGQRDDRGRTLRCGVEHDFGLGDIEPAEHEGSAENGGGEVDLHALRVEERTRRGGLPDVDGVQRDAERAGPVVETGGACLDPELIEKRRGQGAQHERLASRRGEEEGTAGEDHQQQDENDRQAHHRAKSARDEVASLRFRRCCTYPPPRVCHEFRPGRSAKPAVYRTVRHPGQPCHCPRPGKDRSSRA